jgi:release factor glutamine methyltransferase
METILSILTKTTAFFSKYGIESPRLDAELLLAHVLGCNRLKLYTEFERPLTEETLAILRPLLKRRAAREPIQYIIGNTDFMDFTLTTDRRALIPRPETEELVELIVETFRTGSKTPASILDLGTGTGAIACALARQYPGSRVTATDCSADALSLARENVQTLALQERVTLRQSHWFAAVEGTFDLIVSNPPYLADAELSEVAPELLKHEPHGALSSGPTGMEAIEVLLREAPRFLTPAGTLFLETGSGQREAILQLASELGYGDRLQCRNDLNRRHRFVVMRMG